MTTKRTDLPHVRVFQAGGFVQFPPTAYELITRALEANAEWFEGTTLYGGTAMVRLSTVTDVHLLTAEHLAALKADEDADDEEAWR